MTSSLQRKPELQVALVTEATGLLASGPVSGQAIDSLLGSIRCVLPDHGLYGAVERQLPHVESKRRSCQ